MRSGVAEILAVLAFRSVPFVAYACITRSIGRWAKIAALVLLVLTTILASRLGADVREISIRYPAALIYFAFVGAVTHRLAEQLAAGRITRSALLILLSASCVLVPALLVGRPLVTATILLGWNLMLSGYSYCVDTSEHGSRPALSACLFFLLVNPVIIWAERGRIVRPPGFHRRAMLRISLGVGTWMSQNAITIFLLRPANIGVHGFVGLYGHFLLYGALQALNLYLSHSGLASVQIGLVRLLGYEVPERYVYPFLATRPQDFWRRWNIWLGSWAKRYLFFHTAFLLRRRWRRLPVTVDKVIAVLVTFVAVGLLHDFVTFVRALVDPSISASLAMTKAFALFAVALLAWMAVERWYPSISGHRIVSATPWGRRAAAAASWVLFTHVTYAMIWLVNPDPSARAFGRDFVHMIAGILG